MTWKLLVATGMKLLKTKSRSHLVIGWLTMQIEFSASWGMFCLNENIDWRWVGYWKLGMRCIERRWWNEEAASSPLVWTYSPSLNEDSNNYVLPKKTVMASPGAVIMQDNADSSQEPPSENLFASRLITRFSSQQTTKKSCKEWWTRRWVILQNNYLHFLICRDRTMRNICGCGY